MIHEFVMESIPDYTSCHVLKDVKSPWDSKLRAYGWEPERMHELDDDLITVSIVRLVSALMILTQYSLWPI